MNRLVAIGLIATLALLGQDCFVFAGTEEDQAASESADGRPKQKLRRRSHRSKTRASERSEESSSERETGRTLWTETPEARVKTVYDAQGNMVYQKGWDKKTGKEVPVESSRSEAERGPLDEGRRNEVPPPRAYRSLKRDLDGDYEENRSNPRPKGKNHHLHQYSPEPRRHPYEFSLGIMGWSNTLTGDIGGAGGGKASLKSDQRSTMEAEFHNQKTGYSYTYVNHSSAIKGPVTFNAVPFTAGAIFTEKLGVLDGFYRWDFYTSPDTWIDFLLGLKVLFSDVSMKQSGSSSSDSATVPLPQVGYIGQYSLLDNFKIRGFTKVGYGALSSKSALAIDAELEASYTFPTDNEYSILNQFSAGFKYLYLSFTKDKDSSSEASGSLGHSGPYVKYSAYF